MTKHQMQKRNERALNIFPLNGTLVTDTNADARRGFIMGYTAAFNECSEIIEKMKKVLKFECGNRCAEQNPCNAKEALSELKKWRLE